LLTHWRKCERSGSRRVRPPHVARIRAIRVHPRLLVPVFAGGGAWAAGGAGPGWARL